VPEISIIIPTKDRANYLIEAITSIKSQTFQAWECIIIDDGSIDETEEVVRLETMSDSRFRYFKQEHLGSAAARNLGISHAKGKYLSFLDSDDQYLPEGLEKLYDEIEKSSANLVYANYIVYEENTKILRDYHTFSPPSKPELFQCFIIPRMNPILPSACIVEREAFKEVGILNTYFTTSQMVEFWGRFVEKYTIHYLQDFTTIYRRHDAQITSLLGIRRFFYDEIAFRAINRLTIEILFPFDKAEEKVAAIDTLARTLYKNNFPALKACEHLCMIAQDISFNQKRARLLSLLRKNFTKIANKLS
jgi:glycosyltransferase involved in cell wall biosynthesis